MSEIVEKVADRIQARMGPLFGSPEYLADPVKMARSLNRQRESTVSYARIAVEEAAALPTWEAREGCVGKMDAERAIYFLMRFKREEKLLGPHEQWALDFTIAALTRYRTPTSETDQLGGVGV